MTKSEAKSIEQRAGRALRNIEGTGMPWTKMPAERALVSAAPA